MKTDWDKELDGLPHEEIKDKSKPNSLFCKLGFHQWNKWGKHLVELNDKGVPQGSYTVLQRSCERCSFIEQKRFVK